MKINAEFSEAVGVHSSLLAWTPSPIAGVERPMLDRIGGEVARATSIVRYAPGSHFSAHTHSGGEEFIVLEGTFQDEHGDYPAGTYVRNPIGTRHIPRADDGCTIFVKLWQFAHDDDAQVAIDLNDVELAALEGQPGINQATIHQVPGETVMIEHWEPGASKILDAGAGAELLVLEGAIEWNADSFAKHDWIRLPPGASETFRAETGGARVWIKTGHLAEIAQHGWQSPHVD
ncbi:cupin domain-containing protein [Altererythrobacter lutimaris]|uniref:Cupin domain-containing protein n=1 Tax=Altererythrobacter lutimaris TaxID=2743979 RepID=A0A850H9H2_9SPHN|nr:cupin domain-containing protein [Altererythrobacter lutimaris]NVE94543.1 cupin domain-containing protein [Altererythrobacter lutimaris]